MSSFVVWLPIVIVAIVGAFLWTIIQIIVAAVGDIVKHRNEIELKQTLVDRGMSADEIERIVRVTPDSSYIET